MANPPQISTHIQNNPSDFSSANTQALLSFILGLVSLLVWFTPIGVYTGLICGIIGWILGRRARKYLPPQNRTIATIGWICSIIGLSLWFFILLFLFGIVGFIIGLATI